MVLDTEESIIRQALLKAQEGLVTDASSDDYLQAYGLELEGLIERFRFTFAFGYIKDMEPFNVSEDTQIEDLGFRYKYRLPRDFVKFETANYNVGNYLFRNVQEALRFGKSYEHRELAYGGVTGTDAVVAVGSVLYSNTKLDNMIYRRKTPPTAMTATFKDALIYKLAVRLKTNRDTSSMQGPYFLREEADEKLTLAILEDNRRPVNSERLQIYLWKQKYIEQTRSR